MESLYDGVYERTVKSGMCTCENLIMEPQDVRPNEEAIEREGILDPLVVPEFIYASANLPIHEANLSFLRRFDLACGEIKYFRPDVDNTKLSSRAPETFWSKPIPPKECKCFESCEKMDKTLRWHGRLDLVHLQTTTNFVHQSKEFTNELAMINIERDKRSIKTRDSKIDKMVESACFGEDYHNIPTLDLDSSHDGLFSKEKDGSSFDDNSSYQSTPLDLINLCTPRNDSKESPTTSSFKDCSVRDHFFNNQVEFKEEGLKSVLLGINSKQKFQHIVNNESCSNFDEPKSQNLSSGHLSTLMEVFEKGLEGDVEERRRSLISAAIATNLPKFECNDFEMDDIKNMQVLSKDDSGVDLIPATSSTQSSKEFQEDGGLGVHEISLPDVDEEIKGFGSGDERQDQRAFFSREQQTDFPRFVKENSNLQKKVGVAVAVQTSPQEIISTSNASANLIMMPTKLGVDDSATKITCERHIGSDLALLTMGEVQFCFSSSVDDLYNIKANDAQATLMPIININKRALEQTIKSIEFPFREQLKEHQNLDLGEHVKVAFDDITSDTKVSQTPRSSGVVSPKVNNYAFKECPKNIQVTISNDMAKFVLDTMETRCTKFWPHNNCENKGSETFQQRLWGLLYENINKAIDELYFNCELESDLQQMEKALVFLDEANADFKHLKARVDCGFDPVHNNLASLEQPRVSAILMPNTSILSSKGELLQPRRPRGVTWEAHQTACSKDQADTLSSSFEALQNVEGCPQSNNLQDRQQEGTSCHKKESSIGVAKLLPRTMSSTERKLRPLSSSPRNRFMSPTMSSEQRTFCKERQNLNVSSLTTTFKPPLRHARKNRET